MLLDASLLRFLVLFRFPSPFLLVFWELCPKLPFRCKLPVSYTTGQRHTPFASTLFKVTNNNFCTARYHSVQYSTIQSRTERVIHRTFYHPHRRLAAIIMMPCTPVASSSCFTLWSFLLAASATSELLPTCASVIYCSRDYRFSIIGFLTQWWDTTFFLLYLWFRIGWNIAIRVTWCGSIKWCVEVFCCRISNPSITYFEHRRLVNAGELHLQNCWRSNASSGLSD